MSTFTEIMAQSEKSAPITANALDEQFWNFSAQKKLCFQQCKSCKAWRHLPRYMCAKCGSEQWCWEESQGKGSIYSWTVVHLPMHPAFTDDVPYAVAIIELEEGVRMVARLLDIELDQLALGFKVEVCYEEKPNEPLLPYFRPRSS